MSLYAPAPIGSLMKEYRPKAAASEQSKTHADSWMYADDDGGWGGRQDGGAWPDKDASPPLGRDDFPPDAEPTFEPRAAREDPKTAAKPKVEAAPASSEYRSWKAAQTRSLAGYDPNQKGRKAAGKVPAVKMPKGRRTKA